VLYYLYQYWAAQQATNAANAANTAQQNALNQEYQNQQEQSALSDLIGGGVSGVGSSTSSPVNSQPVSSSPITTPVSTPPNTPANPVSGAGNNYQGPQPVNGGPSPYVFAPLTPGEGIVTPGVVDQNYGTSYDTGTFTAPTGQGPSTVASTLLGNPVNSNTAPWVSNNSSTPATTLPTNAAGQIEIPGSTANISTGMIGAHSPNLGPSSDEIGPLQVRG